MELVLDGERGLIVVFAAPRQIAQRRAGKIEAERVLLELGAHAVGRQLLERVAPLQRRPAAQFLFGGHLRTAVGVELDRKAHLAIVPLDGDPTLLVMEPQYEEALRTAWTADVRPFPFYDPTDARPPAVRAQARCLELLAERERGRVGLERSQGTQAADRMVGEPTVFWSGWFDGFDAVATEVLDAAPLLARARMIKTAQELERMRLANELATLAMEEVRDRIRPGMRESEVGAMFEAHVHAIGTGYQGTVELAMAFTLVWAGPGIRTFSATGNRPVLADEPTLLEIWVCADGYWSDLTKNACPGTLRREYDELLDGLLGVYGAAVDHVRPGAIQKPAEEQQASPA